MTSRKGDISLSFGMIFSIIVIIAVIGVAIYAITAFLNLQRCTQISLFYDDFQKEIDRGWSSEYVSDNVEGTLPGSIDKICFGNLTTSSFESANEYDEFKRFRLSGSNLFLAPARKACDSVHVSIKHLNTPDWKCFVVKDGKVSIPIKKQLGEALVQIQ